MPDDSNDGPEKESLSHRIHDFLDAPRGRAATAVQLLIIVLIITSVVMAVIEIFYEDLAAENENAIALVNVIILAAFTLEYSVRLASAPRKLEYAAKPLNIIDLLAIVPNYLELLASTSYVYSFMGLRAIRLIRLLRVARLIRGLMLLRFVRTIKRVFQYEGTILQAITPMIALGIVMKGVIWFLESRGLWLMSPSLGELFAIIGFAMGIILSQKIGVSYDKFIRVEEASVRIYGNLQTLRLILNGREPGLGNRVCEEWAGAFLRILEDPEADNFALNEHNDRLYGPISAVEADVPDQFWTLHAQLCCDASFCLNKKVRLTPRAYDLLLHQATIIYLFLIAVFIPGFTGMVSVLVATYILYGMYNLTQDLDSIIGGEYNLINIHTDELRKFVNLAPAKAEERAA